MKSLKKTWRMICLILMLSLALIGIGFGAGVPIPPSNRRENHIEVNVARIDDQEDDQSENERI
ncbi:hypothetical protein [Pedobacter gandavensis]|uniref:hypothetical protein n=1 Tax=Pedobacter gandavensis TaxID=2679963 RepID=UPI00292E882C|nr:hypothetical protein [Pedobacter gandavensis]